VELALDGETLSAGFGRRLDNRLSWREPIPRRMAASARWNSEHELELLVSCCETPFQWSIRIHADEGSVKLVREENVSFRTRPWPELTGVRAD